MTSFVLREVMPSRFVNIPISAHVRSLLDPEDVVVRPEGVTDIGTFNPAKRDRRVPPDLRSKATAIWSLSPATRFTLALWSNHETTGSDPR